MDGSASALTAVAWTADEAARRHLSLRVVNATLWPTIRMPAAHCPIEFQQPLPERSRTLVDAAAEASAPHQFLRDSPWWRRPR